MDADELDLDRIAQVYGVDVTWLRRERATAREDPAVQRLRAVCEWSGVRLSEDQLRDLAREMGDDGEG